VARHWLLGWVMLGMVVSACGGGDGDAPAAEPPPDATAAADEPPPDATAAADEPAAGESPEGDDASSDQAADDEGGFTPLAPGEGVTVSPAGTEVTSDDGRLELSFPAGAVADETVVAVTALVPGDRPGVLDGLDPAAVVYQLEPSGLTFDQPVPFVLTMDLATTDDGLIAPPVAILVGDDGDAEVAAFDAEIDPIAGTAVLTGAVEHFSMIVGQDGALAVGLEQVSPKDRKLATPWPAEVEVRNNGVPIAGVNLGLIVNAVDFGGGGPVEVDGSASHPGFALAAGASQKLGPPAPRWQCGDIGKGEYRVVVRAELGITLFSTVTFGSVGDNPINATTRSIVEKLTPDGRTTYSVSVKAAVNCELPQFNASGGGENLSVSGQVDITGPFTLQGAIVGGTVTLNFTPTDTGSIVDAATKQISSSGTFTYSGGGDSAMISGSGTYTISGAIGQPLSLAHHAGGCANPGECKDTEGDIVLTPVA
jgi:hypothetical protein